MLEVARKAITNKPAHATTANSRVRTNPRATKIIEQNGRESIEQSGLRAKDPVAINQQTKVPVIIGEAHYQGMIPVDGILLGQLGGNGGSLGIRQKTRNTSAPSQPELSGQITFRDVVRVNGHIAGTVYSEKGTLIVDSGAAVDANVDVAIAVIKGTVTGDIVAQQRIEIGRGAKVFGNIWTRSIKVEVGAT
ncbi:MAG TPA: polymer-forming cytoskeletal protein, partial [Pyrinomonadaceae bacterium]|nr:polymer-forming cytoskeletal protein [Pyrinomonadaceae bacterium]